MNTKLQGLAQRADKLLFTMEGHADTFATRLEALEAKGLSVFVRGHAVLNEREGHLNDIESFVKSMEQVGSNGGPPLEPSPDSPDKPVFVARPVPSGATPA